MADPPLDDRSPLAIGAAWSATIITVSLEMVVPIGLGHLIDTWLGIPTVFVILGAVTGMALGMWHLIRLVSTKSGKGGPPSKHSSSRDEDA